MRHRVFIAVNLPESVKNRLFEYQNKWPELPVRWVRPESAHITLAFVGYTDDEGLVDVCNITEEVAKRNRPFEVVLTKICYGPPEKMPPRMFWVTGDKSRDFSALRQDLEASLSASQRVSFVPEGREFFPHITLGRINQWAWKKIEPEERPEIDEDLNLRFFVDSIDVMESELRKGGPKYTILGSCKLEQ